MAYGLQHGEWVSKPPVGSTINWGHPLAKGLVVSTIFNENGGVIYKNLANNNKSGSSVGATYTPVWKPSLKGSSLYFDGTNDVVNLGDYPDVATKLSIVALVKFSNSTRSYFDTIIAKRNGQDIQTNFALRRGTVVAPSAANPYIEFYLNDGGNWCINYDSRVTLESNKYYMIAVTYANNGTPPIFYNNGVVGITTSDSGLGAPRALTTNNYNCYIGGLDYSQATTQNNEGFLGNISFVYVWSDRILSKQEIQSLYTSPYQFITPVKRRFYSIPTGQQGGWTGPINKKVRMII